jgi:uncharacterized membrane protein YhaH (DUF805 family)
VKDTRIAEIAWLLVIAVLVAAGGFSLLHLLAQNKLVGLAVVAAAIFATVMTIRRTYDPAAPGARREITKAAAYCCAAVLALIPVATGKHQGIAIVAAEVALIFDIVSIAARPRIAEEQ